MERSVLNQLMLELNKEFYRWYTQVVFGLDEPISREYAKQGGDLETIIDKNGYERDGVDYRLVHRTVAYFEIYLPNRDKFSLPFSCYQVHHIDENKRNNDPTNLEILTRVEHMRRHGLLFDDVTTMMFPGYRKNDYSDYSFGY